MTACYGQEKQPLLQVVIYFSLQNTIYSCNILISKYFLGGVRPCSSLFLHFVNFLIFLFLPSEADLHPAVPEASSAALPLFCFSLPELHHCSLDLKHFILDNIACIRFYGYNITYFRTDQSNTNR